MTLTLRAVSLADQPLTQPITAHFDTRGGTIGRADHNAMALPDPQRRISRRQAQISSDGNTYLIRNVGSANPIAVNGRPLAQGDAAALCDGDRVRVGSYVLDVALEPDAETATAGPEATCAADSSAARRAAPLSGSNPFADLMGPPAGPAASASAPALPENFDPFAAPPAPAPLPEQAAGAGPFGDLVPQAAGPSIDEAFGLPASGPDALAAFVAGADAAPAEPGPAPPASAAPAAQAAQADHAPAWQAAWQPPAAARPTAPAIEPPPAPRADSAASRDPDGADSAASLWQAFCEGAGVAPAAAGDADAARMRMLGSVLRSAVDGTLRLMAVRAATKVELHAQVTMIQSRGNNPLKFSPDAQAAIEAMLQPPARGFLPPAAAMTDAMHDLVGHAIGSLAGTQAALEGVLARFSPQQLEAQLQHASALDSLWPANRRARLWSLYLQHFDAIRDEAQEDFQTLFGKAFLAAYEQQLERLGENEPSP